VAAGRLSLPRLADVVSGAPARVFGLAPRKGAIAVGADADLVLVDPNGSTDLGRSHMATDYSPFAGLSGSGRVVQTWLRGRPALDGESVLLDRGCGVPLLAQPART
jgi:dihydropyrimidinase